MKKILVTGASGFIGHHLIKYLQKRGYWVRGADIKFPKYEVILGDEFVLSDLRKFDNCRNVVKDIDYVFHLAANMGGIGFIESHKAEIVHDNILINMHMLEASKINKIEKFLYTSSACVYPGYRQNVVDVAPLKEEDAYPADAEDGYGWEKLFTERACRHYFEDYGLTTYCVRFHNIFGPFGTFDGGREKSPAALCRKIALAKNTDTIEVWGDGDQTRSYCYINDCVEGLYRLINSTYTNPLNLGTDRMVSINELVDIIAKIAEKNITKQYDLTKSVGVRGRNSDNTRLKKILKWEPKVTLEEGLNITYNWINQQVNNKRN